MKLAPELNRNRMSPRLFLLMCLYSGFTGCLVGMLIAAILGD